MKNILIMKTSDQLDLDVIFWSASLPARTQQHGFQGQFETVRRNPLRQVFVDQWYQERMSFFDWAVIDDYDASLSIRQSSWYVGNGRRNRCFIFFFVELFQTVVIRRCSWSVFVGSTG